MRRERSQPQAGQGSLRPTGLRDGQGQIPPLGVLNWETQGLGTLALETKAAGLGLHDVDGVRVALRNHVLAKKRQSKLRKADSGK